jgi:hypothetical protein
MSEIKSAVRRRITPSVPYTLDVESAGGDKFSLSFRLSYDLNALCEVEEALGKSMLTDLSDILDKPTIKVVTVLLWAALLENHSEYSGPEGLAEIRNLITLPQLKPALAACMDAFVAQLPEAQRDRIRKQANGEVLPNVESATASNAQ